MNLVRVGGSAVAPGIPAARRSRGRPVKTRR